MTPAPEPGAFDAARYQARTGFDPDPALMSEFNSVAADLGIDQRGGEELLALHQRAVQAAEERYAQELANSSEALAASFAPADLEAARAAVNDPRLTPPEMRDWIARWGSHPALAKMLVTWAAAIAGNNRGRRY
jgi:hypothetical protein